MRGDCRRNSSGRLSPNYNTWRLNHKPPKFLIILRFCCGCLTRAQVPQPKRYSSGAASRWARDHGDADRCLTADNPGEDPEPERATSLSLHVSTAPSSALLRIRRSFGSSDGSVVRQYCRAQAAIVSEASKTGQRQCQREFALPIAQSERHRRSLWLPCTSSKLGNRDQWHGNLSIREGMYAKGRACNGFGH